MTEVIERPILFSGPMVRAILEGRKTQTRRVIKHGHVNKVFYAGASKEEVSDLRNSPVNFPALREGGTFLSQVASVCHYGQPGDQLWVRETWSLESLGGYMIGDLSEYSYEVTYKAGRESKKLPSATAKNDPYLKMYTTQRGDWRPSIHMPRWASRITLEVTAVRVERLQTITQSGILAEGIPPLEEWTSEIDYRAEFRDLWDGINGKRAPWASNPWVWVIEFKNVPDTVHKRNP